MSAASTLTLNQRMSGALMGLFIGDALAMPVHWMYNLGQLRREYGVIRGYVKPRDQFSGSIMNLSNTGGGGRGSDKGSIIGDVINHGKKKYWGRGLNYHYHLGLQAGENTLEGQLTRLLLRNIAEQSGVNAASFLGEYVKFMTTPGSHNDTYASTCHRMFFANYVNGVDPSKCADNDGHNTDAIDALTLAVPVIVATTGPDGPSEHVRRKAREIVALTRRSSDLPRYVDIYADLLSSILTGTPLRLAVVQAASKVGVDVKQSAENAMKRAGQTIDSDHANSSMPESIDTEYVGGDGTDPMAACYIDSSFVALLHLAYRYANKPGAALLANANAGGENVARGSALGALIGAAHGVEGFPKQLLNLYNREQIEKEIAGVANLVAHQ